MKLLLALTLLCAAARGESGGEGLQIEEWASPVGLEFSGPQPVVSADGYHFTAVVFGKDDEEIYVDAKKIATGPAGTFTRTGDGVLRERSFIAGISRDGKVAAHALKGKDAEGRPGVRLAVNGKPVGRAFAEIHQIEVSPGGANVAYVAETPEAKFLVVSGDGAGPSVGEPPKIAGVSDSGLVYRLMFNGKAWVYRNHAAIPDSDYAQIAVPDDLSRVAGATSWSPHAVKIDGKELGRWADVDAMRYSPEGSLLFLARTDPRTPAGQYDALVVDGRETRLPAIKPSSKHAPAARPGDRVSFLVDDAGTYGILHMGGRAMPEIGEILPAKEWIGFSPSGRHWAVVVSGEKGYHALADGKESEMAASPLKGARIVFDSETEFHYLSDAYGRIGLVCARIGEEVSPRSVCSRNGAALGHRSGFLKVEPAIKATLHGRD